MSAIALSAALRGIGVLGPGMSGWPAAAAALAGRAPFQSARTLLPIPQMLPAAERRRAGRVIKLALAVGAEAVAHAGAEARSLPSVFASSGGDGDNIHAICVTLAGSERSLSPTRFHNSVHNAAAGYWCIACGCSEASVTLCAFDASFGAGLLEALSQVTHGAAPVLLIAYDADYPPPLQSHRPIPDAFGVSLLLAPIGTAPALCTLRVTLSARPATHLEHGELEALRLSIPAARSLPLLAALAPARAGTVILDYLGDTRLQIELQP